MERRQKKPHSVRIIKFAITGMVFLIAVFVIFLKLFQAKPNVPEIEAATIRQDAVKQGEMLRQVKGMGTLVPEVLLRVPAPFAGRVEKINSLAGAIVNIDSIIVELKNPEMEQQALDAAWSLQTAESDLANLKAQIQSQRVVQRTDLATLRAQHRDSKLKNDRDQVLYKEGLMLELDYRLSIAAVEDLAARIGFEEEKDKAQLDSLAAQLLSKETLGKQLREMLELRRTQLAALKVRAGVAGTMSQVTVQVGQQVSAGADLAVVIQPRKLKVALAVAESQARDIALGQKAEIDMQNGKVPGHVARIDPSVVNGTRTVDVALDGSLPPGAVPDKSVDGTIEIERLGNVVYVARAPFTVIGGEMSIFKISADGKEAIRTQVRLGRGSINTVEVLSGLKVGDRFIITDMSAYDGSERVRLK